MKFYLLILNKISTTVLKGRTQSFCCIIFIGNLKNFVNRIETMILQRKATLIESNSDFWVYNFENVDFIVGHEWNYYDIDRYRNFLYNIKSYLKYIDVRLINCTSNMSPNNQQIVKLSIKIIKPSSYPVLFSLNPQDDLARFLSAIHDMNGVYKLETYDHEEDFNGLMLLLSEDSEETSFIYKNLVLKMNL